MENRYLTDSDLRTEEYVNVSILCKVPGPVEVRNHRFTVRFVNRETLFKWLTEKCNELKSHRIEITNAEPYVFGTIVDSKVYYNNIELPNYKAAWSSGGKPVISRHLIDKSIIYLD